MLGAGTLDEAVLVEDAAIPDGTREHGPTGYCPPKVARQQPNMDHTSGPCTSIKQAGNTDKQKYEKYSRVHQAGTPGCDYPDAVSAGSEQISMG